TTTRRDAEQSGRTVTFTTEDIQKKKKNNDMAFISSSTNSNNEDGNTVCVTTASIAFPTGSVNVAIISQDIASAYIASQSNGSQIKFEDINQINEDDMEEIDIKCNMALLSMMENKFWKRTGKKISIQGSDVADGNTVCVTTATTPFPTGSVDFATISQDTASAFIASQSNSSQIKFEDINQIDEDDMEEMDIKWNIALLSMRADKFWKRTGKKISIQGLDVAGFDKSKVECFNCHKMGHFARECRAPRNQERVRKESYRQGSKAKEKSSKALMAIDGVGWDWSYMANEEDHALVANRVTPIEFALMANNENKVFDNSLCSKECRKNTESLNNKIDELKNDIEELKNDLYEANVYRHSYKLGMDQLEVRIAEYKEREVKYIETIRAPRSQEIGRRESYRQGSKAKEKSSKALMAIDGIGWDWSYMANEEDHALVADGETPTEFALMANIKNKVFDNSLCSKDYKKNTDSLNSKINEVKNELSESNTYRYSYKLGVDQLEGRLVEYREREVKYIEKIRTLELYRESNLESIKILENEVETLNEEKDVVDGKLACLLKSSKDLENIIESQRPSPVVVSTSAEDQNKDTSTSEVVASPNPPKPFVKFVKPKDIQPESKLKEQETPKKSQVKYPEQNRHSNKRPKGNQRN
nr:hypothetical protein [Tanacetum cinerariifolium]